MKRIIIFIAFFAFICSHVQAQSIFISKDEKFNYQNGDFDLVGRLGDKIYAYKASSEGYFLNAYNDSMRLTSIIALDFFPRKVSATQFFISGNNIVVFYRSEEKNNIVQYAALLDENARLLQKPKPIDSIKKAWIGESGNINVIESSADKSKFCIARFKNNSVIKEMDIHLLDNSLNNLYERKFAINNDQDLSARQLEVSNAGRVYFLAEANNRYANKLASIVLWRMDAASNTFIQSDIAANVGKFPSGAHIKLDRQQDVCYIAAFYSARKYGNIEGMFYGKFSADNQEPDFFHYVPFDEDLRSEATASNKKKAFDDYSVEDIIIKNNGGILLVAESNTVVTRSSYNGPNIGFYSPFYNMPIDAGTVEFDYGDIMTLDADADGKILWRKFIRKEQVSQDDGGTFSSFSLLNSGGSLVFVFNDYLRNNSGVQLAAVDVDGNLQMQKLDTGGDRLDLIPRLGKQTGNREMIIPYVRKGSIGVVRIIF